MGGNGKRLLLLSIITGLLLVGGITSWVLIVHQSESTKIAPEHSMAAGTHYAGTSLQGQPGQARKPKKALAKVTLSGGAWLTRKNGSSDIIRGLDLFIFKSKVEKRVLSKALDFIMNRSVFLSNMWRSKDGQNIFVHATPEQLSLVAGDADEITKTANAFHHLSEETLVELDRVYSLYAALDRLRERSEPWLALPGLERRLRIRDVIGNDFFSSVFPSAFVCTVKTGIDGKYKAKAIDEGDYCLYARYNTDNVFIEWVVKVNARGNEEAVIDLSNDNASIIINKPLE